MDDSRSPQRQNVIKAETTYLTALELTARLKMLVTTTVIRLRIRV